MIPDLNLSLGSAIEGYTMTLVDFEQDADLQSSNKRQKIESDDATILLHCLNNIEIIQHCVEGESYVFLQNHPSFPFETISFRIPPVILIRKSTIDLIKLFKSIIPTNQSHAELITGTPGIGKSVSIIVWLYAIIVGVGNIISCTAPTATSGTPSSDKLEPGIKEDNPSSTTTTESKADWSLPFQCVIVDVPYARGMVFAKTTDNLSWTTHQIDNDQELKIIIYTYGQDHCLYLYDVTDQHVPRVLPCRKVVFSAPDITYFKEFYCKTCPLLKTLYYMPTWTYHEVIALQEVDPELRHLPAKELFQIWGGLPRYLFHTTFEKGKEELDAFLHSTDLTTCLQRIAKRPLLAFSSRLSDEAMCSSLLLHLEVMEDSSYEQVMITFEVSIFEMK